jgi:CO/xanthine dehydrogenase Mo-binding subunit
MIRILPVFPAQTIGCREHRSGTVPPERHRRPRRKVLRLPKSMTDGDWLVGYGCATSCYPTQMAPAAARVRLQRDGRVRVQIAGHEIGNGAYTVIGQAAAEKLGVPVDKVSVFIVVRSARNSSRRRCRTRP